MIGLLVLFTQAGQAHEAYRAHMILWEIQDMTHSSGKGACYRESIAFSHVKHSIKDTFSLIAVEAPSDTLLRATSCWKAKV